MSSTRREFVFLLLLIALYFSLYTPSRSLESDEDKLKCFESVDCTNELPSSCQEASINDCSILVNKAAEYAYSDQVVSFTGTVGDSCPGTVTNFECFVDGCKSSNTTFTEQTLRCDVCTNIDQTTEVVFRAFILSSTNGNHIQHTVCSNTAYLHPIGKPTKVTDLAYELDCRGFTVSWNHSKVNTTHYRVTISTNSETLYQNTTENTSFFYTTTGWNRTIKYNVTVQALNPSGASEANTMEMNLNKNSNLNITKHLVRITDDNIPTLQLTMEPFTPNCPLRRPTYLHTFITCHYEGQEQKRIHLPARIEDGQRSVILNLREIRTTRHCEATLSIHGRTLATFNFSMFDVQNVTITVRDDAVLVECIYALNSQAQGCCIKSTTQRNLDPLQIRNNVEGPRPFGPLSNGSHHLIVSVLHNSCSFSEVAFEVYVTIRLPMNNSNETTNRKDFLSGGQIGAIAGSIILVLVIILLFVPVGSVVLYHYWKKTKSAELKQSGENQSTSQSQPSGEMEMPSVVCESSSATATDNSFTNLLDDYKANEELVRNKSVIPKSPPGAVLSFGNSSSASKDDSDTDYLQDSISELAPHCLYWMKGGAYHNTYYCIR